MSDRPFIMLDLDGVIARPALGWNVVISRTLSIPPLPEDVRRATPPGRRSTRHVIHRLGHEVRYLGRRPLPIARDALAEIVRYRRPIIVTGRSWLVHGSIRRWLERHDLTTYIEEVVPNDTNLRTAQFKLRVARSRQIEEQVDDDGSIAYYLARNGLSRVYLCDWPRNRGLPYPPNVVVVPNLLGVAEDLARRAGALPADPAPEMT
ncbi:MAG TPA: hypothetical protein VHL09_04515 [Dehalococcoidia bacterium]|nr:hypothetical protein [Dehalococcoidia bacterium]